MKKLLLCSSFIAFFAACTTTSSLYNWGTAKNKDMGTRYEELAYKNFDKQSPESICDLLCLYEYLINNPGGTRGVVPPGICAEYGYLLLKADTPEIFLKTATKQQKKALGEMSDYSSTFREKGLSLLEKEIELYPESSVFLLPLIKKFKGQ